MYKKLVCLTLFMLVSGLTEAQAQDVQWIRAAYWDGRYPVNWSGDGVAMRDALAAAGYTILDADELKTWMDARIADKAYSVVVFCRDIVPDTIAESASASCTLRRYLDAGGKIVWYADIPFWDLGHADGSKTNWSTGGSTGILGFYAASGAWDAWQVVSLTAAGNKWGLTQTWQSQRPTDPGATANLTVLATDNAGNAAGWVKHYVPGDKFRGFVRLWDRSGGTTPPVEDVIRVAEYTSLKADNPSPADGAEGVTTPLLMWEAGSTAQWHDVYFGTTPDLGSADFVMRNPQNRLVYYHTGEFVPGQTYYWRIDEVEADGVTIYTGDVWSFTATPLTASNPTPADRAKFVPLDTELSWLGGTTAFNHDVYFGTDEVAVTNGTGDTFKGTQPQNTYTPPELARGTTYYWRVDEVEMGGATTHTGDVWSFSTIPVIAVSDPSLVGWWKLDEGMGSIAVDWSGHEVHGSFRGNPQWVNGYDGGALELDGRGDYVDFGNPQDWPSGTSARSMCGWAKTDSIAPGYRWIAAYGLNITSQAMFIGMLGDDLLGGGYGGDDVFWYDFWEVDVWHHICLTYDGTTARLYVDGVEVAAEAKTWDLVLSRAHIGRQVNDAAEFWDGTVDDVRIYNKTLTEEEIKQAMRGDTSLAWDPSPADGSTTDVERAVPLSWKPGEKASQHDVYLGTVRNAVADADASDTTGIYRGQQGFTSYTPSEALQWGQTYYWRIDEQNTDMTTSTGRLWSFTVADYLIIDDFEDYNDYSPDRIWQTWLDGVGYSEPPPGYAGNGTGSQVGNDDSPFTEQTTVHSGRQAMTFRYTNDGSTGKALYSEAEREWAAPQDWTRKSIKALTLWFYGDAANSVEPLYVGVQDSLGTRKDVPHENSSVVLAGDWQEWNIDLQEFANAGVNLTSIKKMYIGVGNRLAPQTGGTGTLYFDDIRLYKPRCVPSLAKPDAELSGDCAVNYADLEVLTDQWLGTGYLITPQAPSTTGLVAHYTFDNNTNDSSGNGYHGTAMGTPTYTTGKFAQAINLDGVDDYVDFVNPPDWPSGTSARSMCGWGKTDSIAAGYRWIAAYGTNVTSQAMFIGMYGDDLLGGGYGDDVRRNDFWDVGTWHHICLTYDGTTARLYADGIQVDSAAKTWNLVLSRAHVGRQVNDAAEFWDGTVDDVRIYSRALSHGEVAYLGGLTEPFSEPFDFNADDTVDFADYAVLMDAWLEELLWP